MSQVENFIVEYFMNELVSYGDFHKSIEIEYDWSVFVIKRNFCGTFKNTMKL